MVFAPLRVGNAFPNLSPSRPVVVIPNLGAQFEISSTALFFTSSNLNWKRVTSCYIGGNLLNTIKHLNSHESNLKKKKKKCLYSTPLFHHRTSPHSALQLHSMPSQVGTLDGAREAMASGDIEAWLWEKFTTKHLVDTGAARAYMAWHRPRRVAATGGTNVNDRYVGSST